MTLTESTKWPYPVHYDVESSIDADLLVLGGGLAGPMAAITAAKKGLKVVLVDKGCTMHSGSAGSGVDHWVGCPNPASPVSADELSEFALQNQNGYVNGIAQYIKAKESYDALEELESYGAKVRDSDDLFKGAEFRDEKTKLLFARDYVSRIEIRIWGRTFKPALNKELIKCGVKLFERVMTTGLLTEGGKQGARVIGAVGFNVRTGQFYIFRAKATIICMGHPGARGWLYSAELSGVGSKHGPGLNTGDGSSMAWRAGAELTMLEKTGPLRRHHAPTEGSNNTSWFPCSLVDADGKEIPWMDRDGKILTDYYQRLKPAPGQKIILPPGGPASNFFADFYYDHRGPSILPDLQKRVENGEYKLPLYCDFPSMPESERRVIYGLMIGHEGTTWLGYHNMTRAGFDPGKHQLQVYDEPSQNAYGWRRLLSGGGVVVDWDMKTSLEGLYAAGDQMFGSGAAAGAITSGRHAARKASMYIKKTSAVIPTRGQIDAEKSRVYAPLKRESGLEWKELASGVAKVMRHYCGDTKSDERLNIGLTWLNELTDGEAQTLAARNPHELMRSVEVLSILDWCKAVMHQNLARKSSNPWMNFVRLDYPQQDPPEWRKWITIKQSDGGVSIGEKPLDYWGDLVSNYEKHRG